MLTIRFDALKAALVFGQKLVGEAGVKAHDNNVAAFLDGAFPYDALAVFFVIDRCSGRIRKNSGGRICPGRLRNAAAYFFRQFFQKAGGGEVFYLTVHAAGRTKRKVEFPPGARYGDVEEAAFFFKVFLIAFPGSSPVGSVFGKKAVF
jgi:hypothetical protein